MNSMSTLTLACMVALIAAATASYGVEAANVMALKTDLENELMGKTDPQVCIDDITDCPTDSSKECTESSNRLVENCNQICQAVYEGTEFSDRVIPACHIGCTYAKNFKEGELSRQATDADNCAMACQWTVWNYGAGNPTCNYNKGLGINVPELKNFGAGKACRTGCVFGNQDTKL